MQSLGALLDQWPRIGSDQPIVACCKGVDLETLFGPVGLILSRRPEAEAAILTGPSFAADIARGLPTALTLATTSAGEALQEALSTPTLRLYRTDDLRGAERDKKVQELLDQIEMGKGFADRYPAELSGGQKQRVCIARSLAAKPKLIICDEVTSALDPLVAEGILALLLDLQKQENVAYLFITHDLATVKSIADSIAVMYKGQVVRYGPKADVLAPPFDDYTDLLLSSVPEMRLGWLEEVIARRKMESAGN